MFNIYIAAAQQFPKLFMKPHLLVFWLMTAIWPQKQACLSAVCQLPGNIDACACRRRKRRRKRKRSLQQRRKRNQSPKRRSPSPLPRSKRLLQSSNPRPSQIQRRKPARYASVMQPASDGSCIIRHPSLCILGPAHTGTGGQAAVLYIRCEMPRRYTSKPFATGKL